MVLDTLDDLLHPDHVNDSISRLLGSGASDGMIQASSIARRLAAIVQWLNKSEVTDVIVDETGLSEDEDVMIDTIINLRTMAVKMGRVEGLI